MAENKRPLIAIDSPPKYIDFATIKKNKKNGNKVSQSPMAGDKNYNAGGVDDRLSVLVDTARMQLISPPPEEVLRKRKIPSPQPLEATPNPKPRKQGRLHSTVLGARSSRRSATSIPPYEPPSDVFMSPREVFLTPMLNKSSKRKTTTLASGSKSTKSKKKTSLLTIVTGVKQEPPDIDLSLPMPPPSPTDDPLLLLGPPEPEFDPKPTTPGRREMSVQAQMEPEVDAFGLWDRDFPSSSLESPSPMDHEGEGEYTGRWKMMLVRTKQDPPSSATRGRMEEWGRPISPFPKKMLAFLEEEEEEEEIRQMSVEFDDHEGRVSNIQRQEENEEEQEVRQASVEFDDEDRVRQGEQDVRQKSVRFDDDEDRLFGIQQQEENEEEQEVRQMSVAFDDDDRVFDIQQQEENEEEQEEEQEVRQMSVEFDNDDDDDDRVFDIQQQGENKQEQAEEQEVRQMSVEFDDDDDDDDRVFDIQQQEENEEREEEQEVRQMSVEFDEEDRVSDIRPQQETEEPEVHQISVEFNNDDQDRVSDMQQQGQNEKEQQVRQIFVEIKESEDLVSNIQQQEENDEKQKVRQMPIGFDDDGEPAISTFEPCHQPSPASEEDDQSSDGGDELDLVKITSANPRAAARAAAILKQHDYDCYTNIEAKRRHLGAKRRRSSHSDTEDFSKESRRRDVSSSGVAKTSNNRRRSTLGMGVIGDRVFIPGSPAITLPELLQEAELEVRDSPQSQRSLILTGRKGGDPFKTPLPAKYRGQTANNTPVADQNAEVYDYDLGEREWTKEDWKHLDACFTDQRLEVGSRLAGGEQNLLAPVDVISINDVIDKFVASEGGFETVARFGVLWSRENLLERTRALQKKQRLGHIAPPTTPYTPLSVGSNRNVLGGREGALRMQVPDLTPLGRRAAPPRKSRPTSQQPVICDIACKESMPEPERPVIPPTLLAPRYSHLLEEAINISQQGSIVLPEQETHDTLPQSEIEDPTHADDVSSTTIGKRVKSFLFSYLPTLPKSPSMAKKAAVSLQPSLPLPPVDILSKPRGPVVTPARAPVLKSKHPKELVVLHPAPKPSTISHIPRITKPRRLVDLHPPAPPPFEPTPIPRPRRSSGSSVKDLVRGFEEIHSLSHDKIKRTKTNEGCKNKRPQWKP